MYNLEFTSKFKKDIKKFQHKEKEKKILNSVLKELKSKGKPDKKYYPHKLKGEYNDFFECHVLPDLLLIWKEEENIIKLVRLGSHSELFS